MSINYERVKNNPSDYLATALNIGQTTMTLNNFNNLPSYYSYEVAIWNRATYEDPDDDPSMEIISIDSLDSGNTVNISRAQSGTSQSNHSVGDWVSTILSTQELVDEHRNVSNIHRVVDQSLSTSDSPDFAGLAVGTDTDYSEIEADGTLEFNGNATVWDDVRVAASDATKAGNNDPVYSQYKTNGAGSNGIYTLEFTNIADKEVFFELQTPHKWKLGSDLHPHVHWIATTDGGVGETVSWGLEYSFARISNEYGNTTIIYGNTSVPGDDPLVADRHYLTELGTISTSSETAYSVSQMLIGRLFRNTAGAGGSTDNYGAAVRLLEFDIHIEIDTVGSRQEYTK